MKETNIVISENFSVHEADDFRDRLNQLIEAGERHFVMDFSNCTFIDSTGLGALVSTYKKCRELHGSFKIHSINNPQVMRIFKLTRLDRVFEI